MEDASSHDAFVERAYRDAYDLLVSVRDYLASDMNDEAAELAPADRLKLTLELSRLTRQLTSAMAWLMLQKAVIAGEVTAEQAASDPATAIELATADETADDRKTIARLPLAARGLIDRNRRLLAHVSALAGG